MAAPSKCSIRKKERERVELLNFDEINLAEKLTRLPPLLRAAFAAACAQRLAHAYSTYAIRANRDPEVLNYVFALLWNSAAALAYALRCRRDSRFSRRVPLEHSGLSLTHHSAVNRFTSQMPYKPKFAKPACVNFHTRGCEISHVSLA